MTFAFQSYIFGVAFEVLLAELIFLYPCPKRSWFPLRYAAACLAVALISAYFPQFPTMSALTTFLRFASLFVLSVGGMACCFRLTFSTVVSMCAAGYATQHMTNQFFTLKSLIPPLAGLGSGLPIQIARMPLLLLIYSVIFFTFGRFAARNKCYKNSNSHLTVLAVATLFICIGINRFSNQSTIATCLYSITCCLLVLFLQIGLYKVNLISAENKTLQRIRQEEKKQYEITKNTIDLINIKCHDLKHRLNAYSDKLTDEEIEDLRQDVNIYDSIIKTGNDVLNVLLSQKGLECGAKDIRITCSGNCAALSFVSTMDLYSLIGNAVDNAIEAAEQLAEAEKKIIDLSIEQRGDFVVINVSNYFSGEIKTDSDGSLITTKQAEEGYHGFGIKSMRLLAKKYHGDIHISVNKDIFMLNVYLRNFEKAG